VISNSQNSSKKKACAPNKTGKLIRAAKNKKRAGVKKWGGPKCRNKSKGDSRVACGSWPAGIEIDPERHPPQKKGKTNIE